MGERKDKKNISKRFGIWVRQGDEYVLYKSKPSEFSFWVGIILFLIPVIIGIILLAKKIEKENNLERKTKDCNIVEFSPLPTYCSK